jgi:hypothetical protein
MRGELYLRQRHAPGVLAVKQGVEPVCIAGRAGEGKADMSSIANSIATLLNSALLTELSQAERIGRLRRASRPDGHDRGERPRPLDFLAVTDHDVVQAGGPMGGTGRRRSGSSPRHTDRMRSAGPRRRSDARRRARAVVPLALVAVVAGFAFTTTPAFASGAGSRPLARGHHRHGRGCHVRTLSPITYTAFDQHTETLIPWQGPRVTVLTEPDAARDRRAMRGLVCALSRAFSYYAASTGRTPAPWHTLNGRDVIAEVADDSICGAGCGYLGTDGIEIVRPYFEYGYQEILHYNLYDQVPFYELGRNFWFWTPQLAFPPPELYPVVTGFAVWMRFRSMAAARVRGAPFNGVPFHEFRSQVAGLIDLYEANLNLTFASTLGADTSPGAYSGTDFWTSIMMRLAREHGDQRFVHRFWRAANKLPAASSTADAVTNWVHAASIAACTDLSRVFYERWSFPQPNGAVSARVPADTVPEPTGSCR